MSILLSAQSRKAVDEFTMSRGISGEELVENAAASIVISVKKYSGKRIMIFAGCGNNGADGAAAARLLADEGYEVFFCLVGDGRKSSLLLTELDKLDYRVSIVKDEKPDADIVIDAVFGIGLNREVTGEYKKAIETINEYKKKCIVIAADIPSGVCADTGEVLGTSVCADETVVMSYACPGHFLYPGNRRCGRVCIADIGLLDYTEVVSASAHTEYDGELPRHYPDTHKGSYGRLFMLVGAKGMAGAAVLSARAAYRVGCGLVYIDTAKANRNILQISLPEAVLTDINAARPDAVVAGPGLSKTEKAYKKLVKLLKEYKGWLVLDADALNLLSQSEELKELSSGRCILTPHIAELSRLLSEPVSSILKDQIGAAKRAALKYKAIVVSKSARTVVADFEREELFINLKGNPGMATAGSGDVLAGIIGGLLARGLSPFDAARLGVDVHASAGDLAAEKSGESHMMAGDIIENMYLVTKDWR